MYIQKTSCWPYKKYIPKTKILLSFTKNITLKNSPPILKFFPLFLKGKIANYQPIITKNITKKMKKNKLISYELLSLIGDTQQNLV